MTTFVDNFYNYGFLCAAFYKRHSQRRELLLMPKILTLCAPVLKRNMETEFWRNEKNGFYLCLAGGNTQQASTSRTVPPSLGNRGMFYMSMKVLLFFSFFFCKVSKWPQQASVKSVIGSGVTKLSDLTFFLKLQNAPREYRGRR